MACWSINCHKWREHRNDTSEHAYTPIKTTIALGQSIANSEVYIFDNRLQLLPVGVTGELYIGGAGLAMGYISQPRQTAERFVPHPFRQDGQRLYRTGDLVRYDEDGKVEFMGRRDRQVKLRGYRIELAEIEAVLRSYTPVWDCAVLVQDEKTEVPRLVAYIVRRAASGLTSTAVRDFLLGRLPEYMIPSNIVMLETLPLTPNGKVDWKQLPTLEQSQDSKSLVSEHPRSPIEEMLIEIWKELLAVPALGRNENFFAAGGHSLLAMRLITRIQTVLQVELPVQTVFEAPTVADLAQCVEQAMRKNKGMDIPPLLALPRPEQIPLSFAQQRLWFLQQLEPESTAYLVPRVLHFDGPLHAKALEQSLAELITRHEILRTTFIVQEGRPTQVIQPVEQIVLPVIDLQSIGDEEQKGAIRHLSEQETQRPYDLAKGPLLHTYLLRMQTQEHILLLTQHHIITDGWSSEVLARELTTLYQAFIAGQPSPLAPLPLQYADYAIWQRQWLQGQVLATQLAYWKKQLAGVSPLELPTDRPRPPIQTNQGATLRLLLPQELHHGLVALSQQTHVTLFMLLLTAFQVLLLRYTGQSDISVGTPIANRSRAELEGLIGFFVNTLVLRADLSGDLTFLDALTRVHEVCLGAYAHQDIPFEQLVDEIQPERDLSRSPLFQVMFTLQNTAQASQDITGLIRNSVEVKQTTAQFDLSLTLSASDRGLMTLAEFNTDLFDATTIERLLQHWQVLLGAIVHDAGQYIQHLPLLTDAESSRLLIEWNATNTGQHNNACLHELIERQVVQTPDAVAIVFEQTALTYSSLNIRANQLAHRLRRLGVGPDGLVGVYMERSLELVVALLAILKAGGAYLPLDPGYPLDRLLFMVTDAQCHLMLTQTHLAAHCPHTAQRLLLENNDTQFSTESATNPLCTVGPHNLAYVIYTSGSTGTPKGVMNTHEGICNNLLWKHAAYQATSHDHILQKTPLSFDVSVWELFLPLLVGATMILARPEGHKDGAYLASLLRDANVTMLEVVPSLLQVLVDEPAFAACQHLHLMVSGGDALSFELQQRFFAHAPSPDCALYNTYGPTEAAIDVTCWICEHREAQTTIPIGFPITNTQIYLLDPFGNLAPIGVPGDLHIGGLNLARGYLNRPDLTAERFIPDPFSSIPGARLYRTGDLARYRADGALEYIGRRDQQVKLRGVRIEPGEVEAVLRRHALVHECVVLACDDLAGNKRLVAYVVLQQQQPDVRTLLYQYAAENLPISMVPSLFVLLDALPLAPNGKLDRHALPTPQFEYQERDHTTAIAPRTELEAILVQIWSQVLNVPEISIHDNFFSLGGDSILSIQVISRAAQAGLHLTPKQLFQHQTIAQIAQVAQYNLAADPINLEIPSGPVPLTPIQQWFFSFPLPQRHHYNQTLLFQEISPLHIDLLMQTFHILEEYHEALHLRFVETPAGWQQMYEQETTSIPFLTIDLSRLTTAVQGPILSELFKQTQASLELTQGPIWRVLYIQRGAPQQALLLWVIHHLVVDGVSWRVLMEDLHTIYQQLEQNQPVLPQAKTASFPYWAHQLQLQAQTDELQQQLAYWQTLRDVPLAPMPCDWPAHNGSNTLASAHNILIEMNEQETTALLREVPAVYHTQINDVLLTALALAYAQWTGQQCLLVELEGHGRDILPDIDVSRTIGWLTTVFPVLLDLREAHSLGDALKTIKEQLRQLPQRGLGYGLLRYLHPDPAVRTQMDALPQAEIGFNYLGQFDPLFVKHTLLGPAPLSAGPTQDEHGQREHLLSINGQVYQGKLRFRWQYNTLIHRQETMEKVANAFINMLRELVQHCQQPDAGGFTPSDVPLARLQQQELDRLVSRPQAIEDIYALSPLQEGLLFHTLYEPETSAYLVQTEYRFQGALKVEDLQAAWQQLVQRYDILRTSFHWEGLPHPVQMVHKNVQIPWQMLDWSHLSTQEQQERLQLLRQEDRHHSFEVTQAPLQRLLLVRLGEEEVHLLWSNHHLLLDGWSQPLVLQDLIRLYFQQSQSQATTLPKPQPYRTYIDWLQKQDQQQTERYWRQYLAGFTTPNALPTEISPATSVAEEKPVAELPLWLSEADTIALQIQAREQRVTLNTLVQGVWAILLAYYSGQQDVLFGATISGRPSELPGVETMVGLFINTLPVRIHVMPEAEVWAWLRQIQMQQVEARQYEYTSLTQIQGWSEIPRGQELFQSLLVFENYPVDMTTIQPSRLLQARQVYTKEQTHYPLTLMASLNKQTFAFRLSYIKTLFTEDTIQHLLQHIQVLLQALIEQPSSQIRDLPLLTPQERQLLLVQWNATEVSIPHEKGFHQLIEEQAIATPDALALIFQEHLVTYAALWDAVLLVTAQLQQAGVSSGTIVGLCLQRSAELIIGMLAILQAGGAYLPLDPMYPQERLSFMLQDSQTQLVLTQANLRQRVEIPGVHYLDITETMRSANRQAERAILPAWIGPEQVAYMIYTSGSTGKPKGTMIPQRAVINFFASMTRRPGMQAHDRVLAVTAYSFDIAALELLLPLTVGASIQIADQQEIREGTELVALLQRSGTTVLQATPSLWQILLLAGWTGTPELKLLCGGEALPKELARQLVHKGAQLWNMYGPTETTIWSTTALLSTDMTQISIGQAIDNTQLYVLDATGALVPVGVAGELYIGGTGIAHGYWQRGDLTAARFVPDPYSGQAGSRLYRTGDRVRWHADGSLEYLGRLDEQVKLRGYRIEPGEIETVLAEHPQVRAAVVVTRASTTGEPRLVAYVQLEQAHRGNLGQWHLKLYLQAHLPEYMIPAQIVVLEAFPLTPNGKVDKRALPDPGDIQDGERVTQEGARTQIEELIQGLWLEVLGVEHIGISDNFFERGGHSLLAMRLIARVRTLLNLEMPVRTVFEAPTIAGMAQWVEQSLRSNQGIEVSSPTAMPRPHEIPLSFAQQRLWFLDRLAPESTMHLIPTAQYFQGYLDRKALENSLQELVRRHESLRTTFVVTSAGQPAQVIHPQEDYCLPIIDLQAIAEDKREHVARQLAAQESQHPCNLTTGPLLRTHLLCLHAEEHVLLITLHHIITDGWSNAIFKRELMTLYKAFETQSAPPLAPLPIQYADYALWQRQWLQGDVLDALLLYWRTKLAGIAPSKLPTDRPRPLTQSYRGAIHSFIVPLDVSTSLVRLSQQAECTVFITLLAAFQTLLYRESEQDDIVVGTDIANRNQVEIEGLIGFFVNQLVLRSNLAGNPTFRELLQRVRTSTLEAYAHQDLPFEKIVEALQPKRSTQYAPLFQVKIIFEDTTNRAMQALQSKSTPQASDNKRTTATDTAEVDILLRLSQTSSGLTGAFTYSTDLFDATTIEHMALHFIKLLEGISTNPDTRISTVEIMTAKEQEEKHMQKENRANAAFSKFKKVQPVSVTLQPTQLIQTAYLSTQKQLPLVIRPQQAELDLVEWAKDNQSFIESELRTYGALLFRDFKISSPAEFERFTLALCSDPYSENGEHIPANVGDGNLYTPVFYAPEKKLLWHTENSFNATWPMKIWFYCAQPADKGGETPIADNRRVFQKIDPDIREQFMQKKIMYIRNYGDGLGLPWQTVFRTEKKEEVEAYCRKSSTEFQWHGDRLKTRLVRPAVAKHPKTGEWLWWNQATHWHPACLDATVRASLLSLFAPDDLPRNCFYGDGSPIEDAVIHAICDAYQEAEVSFPWRVGDIMMLDNMLAAHARNPYVGLRKLYVSMGEMFHLNDL